MHPDLETYIYIYAREVSEEWLSGEMICKWRPSTGRAVQQRRPR